MLSSAMRSCEILRGVLCSPARWRIHVNRGIVGLGSCSYAKPFHLHPTPDEALDHCGINSYALITCCRYRAQRCPDFLT